MPVSNVKIFAVAAAVICILAFGLMLYKSGGAAINWQTGGGDPVLQFYPFNGSIYAICVTNLTYIGPDGHAAWSVPFPNIVFSTQGDDGDLYVYSTERGLNRVTPDGLIISLTRQGINRQPLIGDNGTVYLRSWSLMMAVDRHGNQLWNATNAISDPVLDRDGNAYFFVRPPESLSDIYLRCVAPNGTALWSKIFDKYYSGIGLKPTMSGGIFISDEVAGDISRIDSQGNVTWDYYKPYLGQYQLAEDEHARLYLFFSSGTVHVLNERGEIMDKFNVDPAANGTAMPVVYNNTVYIAGPGPTSDTDYIYALGADGSTLWKQQVNSTGTATLYPGDGILCVATDIPNGDQKTPVLYVLDSSRGDVKYVYDSGDGREWSQVYVNRDGSILARTDGGMLYALKG
ncbi:MAG TPA: PQQ-binding-like beta-propeller repeat protein [Methanocellaceae archaeon]